MVYKCQLSALLLKGECTVKRQLVQRIFHLERSSFFYLSALMVRIKVALPAYI